jgi:hypothetical protein
VRTDPCVRRREYAPRYSRYLQAMLEFAAALRMIREQIARGGPPKLEREQSLVQSQERHMLRFLGGRSYVTVRGLLLLLAAARGAACARASDDVMWRDCW